MDDKILNKRLRSKVAMHMLFGLGGAVVIIGALFKILHLEIGPITGGLVLGLGLGTEALIFTVAALNTGEIKEEHNDYVKKIKGGAKKAPAGGGGDEGLSSKIDAIMQEAKLDVSLMNSLASSIKGLETSAKALSPASEAVAASQNYSQELAKASTQLEQLNSSYQKQINDSQGNEDFNNKVKKNLSVQENLQTQNAEQLRAQMESLSANLAALNNVYGGMLNAMNKK
jgi:gliding motility-associated protein GldL